MTTYQPEPVIFGERALTIENIVALSQRQARAHVEQRFALFGRPATEAFMAEVAVQRPLGRMSPADMDRMKTAVARMAKRLKELEAEVKAVREQIIATGQDRVIGEFADAIVSLSERSNFDGKLAQSYLTAEQIKACTKTRVVTTVRAKAKTAKEG